jgi:hypothetical protein
MDDIEPNDEKNIITLCKWKSGIPLPTTTTMEESPPSTMNTTTVPE